MNAERKSGDARLSDDARWHIERCDGFLDLRMTARAAAEFALVPAEERDATTALQVGLRLSMETGDWAAARRMAQALRDRVPLEPTYWVQLAFATRRAEGIENARAVLRESLGHFPKIAVIPFNLACYECQLGHEDEALALLGKAFSLDGSFREIALEDEDLKPLWPRLDPAVDP